jgi:hypothetical protein
MTTNLPTTKRVLLGLALVAVVVATVWGLSSRRGDATAPAELWIDEGDWSDARLAPGGERVTHWAVDPGTQPDQLEPSVSSAILLLRRPVLLTNVTNRVELVRPRHPLVFPDSERAGVYMYLPRYERKQAGGRTWWRYESPFRRR